VRKTVMAKYRLFLMAAMPSLLIGCANLQTSTPFPAGRHIALERKLPDDLPQHSSRFPGSQFVLIPQDSAVGMVVPLPFVTDAVLDSVHDREAGELAKRFAGIDPYVIVQKAMAGSTLLADGGMAAQPFAYMIDCKDQRYRMALVARMRDQSWVGRYVVHLSSTYSRDDIATASPTVLSRMGQELTDAAGILRHMLERDARGELSQPLYRADVGSFHLACSDVGGLVSATLLLARNAMVVEEDDQHIVIRGTGDLHQPGADGGLLFGLHYLRKEQLHTFRRLPPR